MEPLVDEVDGVGEGALAVDAEFALRNDMADVVRYGRLGQVCSV